MKLHKIYESIITENNIEGCIKKFGHELFGQELGGKELNTPLEHRYHDTIIDFTDNMYGEEIQGEFFEMVNNLKGCMEQYPEVLVPENSTIYRGTMIPLYYFTDNNEPINYDGCNSFVYRAKSRIQSWTINPKTADGFGDNSRLNLIANSLNFNDYNTPETRKELLNDLLNMDLFLSFKLNYQTNPDEFLFKSKYFNLLSYNGDEDEILRVTNIPIKLNTCIKIGGFYGVNQVGYKLLKLINMAILNK